LTAPGYVEDHGAETMSGRFKPSIQELRDWQRGLDESLGTIEEYARAMADILERFRRS
jgi:hypothetical protein